MDDNNDERSSKSTLVKKSSLKKLTKLGKAIRKRLPKTPKTDRGPASSTESENGYLHGKKKGSLTSRIKKRFSSTPRRSMSFTDLDNLSQKDGPTEEDLDDEGPVFLETQSARPDFLAAPAKDTHVPAEIYMYPGTPVGVQPKIKEMSINSANSGSSRYFQSGTEELSEAESRTGEIRRSRRPSTAPWMDELNKESSEQERTAPVVDSESQDDLQQGAELFQYAQFYTQKEKEKEEEKEALLDAAASIDVGIEETVFESLYNPNLVTVTTAPKPEQAITEASHEEAITTESPKLEQEVKEETPKLEQEITEETPKPEHEITKESHKPEQEITTETPKLKQEITTETPKLKQEITEEYLKPEQEITEECTNPATEAPRVTPRELDLPAMERPSEVTPAEDQEEEDAQSKEVVKPRKGRFRRILLREAPISLATLAVGILFLVFKSKSRAKTKI